MLSQGEETYMNSTWYDTSWSKCQTIWINWVSTWLTKQKWSMWSLHLALTFGFGLQSWRIFLCIASQFQSCLILLCFTSDYWFKLTLRMMQTCCACSQFSSCIQLLLAIKSISLHITDKAGLNMLMLCVYALKCDLALSQVNFASAIMIWLLK